MLINCPRCGFSQPQDQFCAQCGVDMQSYKPKDKPFLDRLLGSTVFQICILIGIAFFIGQVLLKRTDEKRIGQQSFKSQGISESRTSGRSNNQIFSESDKSEVNDVSTKFEEVEPPNVANPVAQAPLARALPARSESVSNNGTTGASASVENAMNFKLTYAEVSIELINRWIVESSSLGAYQSLPEYSMGVLLDFRQQTEKFQTLKSSDIKIVPGSSNINVAGLVSEDNSQLIGFASQIDFKGIENNLLYGHLNVSKGSRSAIENYPADFEMPKGAAFFVVGTLKIENFATERAKLQMPPFQIFKSQDFLTRKTEFVIIIEPDYK